MKTSPLERLEVFLTLQRWWADGCNPLGASRKIMSYGSAISAEAAEPSVELVEGWHCSHLYYRFDRGVLAGMEAGARQAGCDEVVAALDPAGPDALVRMQTSVVSGHKADFGLMLLDPNPLRIDAVHQRLMASPLGPALVPTYSFVSVTEVSEYVPRWSSTATGWSAKGKTGQVPRFKPRCGRTQRVNR